MKTCNRFGRRTVPGLLAFAALACLPALAHTPPPGEPTTAEIGKLLANAKTAADHQKIAKHLRSEASAYEDEAKDYEMLAQSAKSSAKVAGECKSIAEQAKKIASDLRAIAEEQDQLAK